MKCPKCGLVQSVRDVCGRCGASLARSRPPSSGRPTSVGTFSSPRPDYRSVLKRVGTVLIVLGGVDIVFMLYCIVNGLSYSSSLNVFALVAGILLYRGGLGVARLAAHAAALLLGGLLVGVLALPLLVPPRLVTLGFRTASTPTLLGWAVSLAGLAVVVWVYRQLTSDMVRQAMDRPLATRWSLAAGALIVLALVLTVFRSLGGEAHDRVVARAREELGPAYEYFVARMTTTTTRDGESLSAVVLAYDSAHVEPVLVTCEGEGPGARCHSRWRGSPAEEASAEEGVSEAVSGVAADDPLAAGHDRYRSGDFRAAIERYDRALELDSSNTEARYWRGMSHVRLGERDLALTDFDECIARRDGNIDVYIQADRLLVQSRDWARIIDNWTRFIDQNPENGQAYYERGGAARQSGDMDSALRDAEESCRLGYAPACQVLQRHSRR
jgi:hypothetical protein